MGRVSGVEKLAAPSGSGRCCRGSAAPQLRSSVTVAFSSSGRELRSIGHPGRPRSPPAGCAPASVLRFTRTGGTSSGWPPPAGLLRGREAPPSRGWRLEDRDLLGVVVPLPAPCDRRTTSAG